MSWGSDTWQTSSHMAIGETLEKEKGSMAYWEESPKWKGNHG